MNVREAIDRIMSLVAEYDALFGHLIDQGRRINLYTPIFASYLEFDIPGGQVDISKSEVRVYIYRDRYRYVEYRYERDSEKCFRTEVDDDKRMTWMINCSSILRMLAPLADEMQKKEKELGELIQKLRVTVAAMSLHS